MTGPTSVGALHLGAIAAVSALSGAVNSIAGGGTLLTFPALLGLGIPAVAANATSTVALWPGSLASMLGYRRELAGAERWRSDSRCPASSEDASARGCCW